MSTEPELTRAALLAERAAMAEPPVDREARNPFLRYMMHLGLPVTLSVVVHLALVLLLGFKTFGALTRAPVQVGEYEASLVESLEDQIDDAFQWRDPTALEATLDIAPEQSFESLVSLRDFTEFELDELAASPDPGSGGGEGGGAGLGIGDGALTLLGTGGGAAEAGSGGFGSGFGGGGGIGEAGIWDLSIRANEIVYVVDFSGSIIFTVEDLKRELKRSIGRLRPTQSFNVILFYEKFESVKVDSFRPKLEPADEATRRAFFEWIDSKAPMGYTKPMAAMERALALKPDAVFFLSDGDFDDSVISAITRANRTVKARIYCLVFHEDYLEDFSGLPPHETEYSRRLQQIAEANGGAVKIVTGKDLGRR